MKSKWLFLVGLALTGMLMCCSPSPKSEGGAETLSIVIRNETDQPFYCTVGAGALSKSLTVPPRSHKGFWAYKSMIPDTIVMIVTDKESAPAKRK